MNRSVRMLLYLYLACVLLMANGCEAKREVVESVRYVHDTAFFRKDSVVYRLLAFNGTDEEKTAIWTSGTKTDTIWKYRYRTIKGSAGENMRSDANVSLAQIKKDSTANTTMIANAGNKTGDKKGGVRGGWLGWSLFALLALIDIVFFATHKRG